jgi:hypothetical protein
MGVDNDDRPRPAPSNKARLDNAGSGLYYGFQHLSSSTGIFSLIPQGRLMDKFLDQIAEQIIHLDEAALTRILPHYKHKMENFEPTEEWEKAVVIFFMINAVRVKNSIFNEHIKNTEADRKSGSHPPNLKRIK